MNNVNIDFEYRAIHKIKKLLLVEEGSVDTEVLENLFVGSDVEVLVYKAGRHKPEIVNLEE